MYSFCYIYFLAIQGSLNSNGGRANVSMTCKAPVYTPLYWIIPETDVKALIVTNTTESGSSVSHISFQTEKSNNYLGYQ